MVTAHKRKHLKYPELAVERKEAGLKARFYPVEVGYQGFVGRTVVHLLHGAGTMGSNLQKAVKELGEGRRKRASACGFGGKTVIWGQCPSKGRYRGAAGKCSLYVTFYVTLRKLLFNISNKLYNSH